MDSFQIPIGSMARAWSKKFKEAFNELIQEIWAKQMGQEFTFVKKDLSMIQEAVEDF